MVKIDKSNFLKWRYRKVEEVCSGEWIANQTEDAIKLLDKVQTQNIDQKAIIGHFYRHIPESSRKEFRKKHDLSKATANRHANWAEFLNKYRDYPCSSKGHAHWAKCKRAGKEDLAPETFGMDKKELKKLLDAGKVKRKQPTDNERIYTHAKELCTLLQVVNVDEIKADTWSTLDELLEWLKEVNIKRLI